MSLSGVSIVIANFNGIEHLPVLFDSIENLHYPNESVEVIFVDDGSTDESATWVRKNYSQARIIENERNQGFSYSCNEGAANAENEWLAFVNTDIRLDPDWLVNMVEAVKAPGRNTACASSKILSWDGERIDFIGGVTTFYGHSFQKDFGRPIQQVSLSDQPENILFPCGGAMLIRKDIFIEIGGFDADYFAYFEDTDLGWRLWILGHEVLFVPSATAYHKGFSTTEKYLGGKHLYLCERNALYTIYKNYSEENLRKVLPGALILLIHRVLLHTPYLPLELPLEAPEATMKPESGVNASAQSKFTKTLTMLGEAGFKETFRRTCLSLSLACMRQNGIRPISEEGSSTLSALTHLISNLDSLNRKRAIVQAARKRPDSEILSLFGEPFRPLPDTSEFRDLIETVAENFEIDSLFEAHFRGEGHQP